MNRDAYAVPAAHAGLQAGGYILPMGISSFGDRTLSTSAQVNAHLYYAPRTITLDLLRVYLTTAQAGAESMAGIYTNDAYGYPGDLMADLGTKDMSTGGGADKDWTISNLTVPAGWFWALYWNKNVATGITVKGPSVQVGGFLRAHSAALSGAFQTPHLTLTAAYPASMPTSGPASLVPGATTNTPVPMLRIAA